MEKIKKTIFGQYFWVTTTIVIGISRLATILFPFDSDHWVFYYIGKKWTSGELLYVDMWDHKSPIIFGYNGLLHLLGGDNLIFHRAVFTIVAVLSVILFYKTARLFSEQSGLINDFKIKYATLIFAFFSNLSQFTNSGNNNENLGIPFLIGAIYFYLLFRRNQANRLPLLMCGSLSGIVFLLKGNFALLILPIVVDLIFITRKNIYRAIGAIATFGLVPLLELLLLARYFTNNGTFKNFYIAAFEFNSKYIKSLGWDISAPGIMIFLGLLALLIFFFLPFILSSIKQLVKQPSKNLNMFAGAMAICSILFLGAAGTFYSHYFLITLPMFCLLFLNHTGNNRKKHTVIINSFIAVIMLLASYKQLYNSFFGTVAQDKQHQMNVAQYIQQHTNPNEKIFAYIYGAAFYELSHRDSGSRFISASHPLIDYKYNFGYNFNWLLITDLEDSQTKYIVMSDSPSDIYRTDNPQVMTYINHNYHLEKQLRGYEIYRRNQ